MNAIYQGKLYRMGDNLNEAELIDEEVDGVHGTIVVPYSDPDLIIDPTDGQISDITPKPNVTINEYDLITIREALCIASDSLHEQAGWCGDNASEAELRAQASEYYDLYNKLTKL